MNEALDKASKTFKHIRYLGLNVRDLLPIDQDVV